MCRNIFMSLGLLLLFPALSMAELKVESWSDFKNIIKENDVRTVDELLENLPSHFTRGYTLLYRPMALDRHLVTPRRPRVLMYGRKGTFMMTYNSHPSGGKASEGDLETIETIEFVGSRAYLREISFDGIKDPFEKPIAVNPKKCAQCHGKDPRGLWDPYNSWPGAYGSLSRGGMDFIRLGTPEHKGYMEYLEEKKTNPRYSFLKILEDKVLTLSEWSQKNDLFRPFKPEVMHDAIVVADGYTTLTNQILGMAMGEHNFQRLGRLFSELPKPVREKYQYLIKAISLDEKYESPLGKPYNCFRKIDTFFPEDDNRYAHLNSKKLLEEISFAMAMDYGRQKALVERDNRGLSSVGAGFDSKDPFDLDMEGRKLEYDPFPLSLSFANHGKGISGSHILAYVFKVLNMEDYEANISINHARYNFYYGNIMSCHRPKKGEPYEDLCFDESVERFFSTYIKDFYTDPNINNYSCEELSQKSRAALAL